MKKNEEKKINQKRLVLISLSRKARKIKEAMIQRAANDEEAMYWAAKTVNDILMKCLYWKKDIYEFKTFDQWKKEGKLIKKGEKAVLVWGQPRKGTEKIKAIEPNKDDIENAYKFWPICYLFSDKQVV